MNISGKHYYTIWQKEDDPQVVQIIDQRSLPHSLVIENLSTVDEVIAAISEMHVRGAPLIGVAAAFGMYFAAIEAPEEESVDYFIREAERLSRARPTAVNLAWAVSRQLEVIDRGETKQERIELALREVQAMHAEEIERCRLIGEHGFALVEELSARKDSSPVQILTHCNAGWLACVDYGTATAPIYHAHDKGIAVHVWVDETRPRNQGARLTAYELAEHGVPHTVIADNTGGHLMQQGMVDMVLVGSDCTTANGDVVNKIGTYLKALAAKDNNVPFYIGLPSSSIDWSLSSGFEVPIEQRDDSEVKYIQGLLGESIEQVLLTPQNAAAANYAFDVTPSRLVTGLITECGICEASTEGLRELFCSK